MSLYTIEHVNKKTNIPHYIELLDILNLIQFL